MKTGILFKLQSRAFLNSVFSPVFHTFSPDIYTVAE